MTEPLSLSADEMRALGYRVVDALVEHFAGLRDERVLRTARRAEMESLLRARIPEGPSRPEVVLERVLADVLAHGGHVDHPRFFAFVPSPSNFVSVMADALASGFNIFAGTWIEAPGPAQLELVTIDWLREAFSLPDTAGGLFVSGGSVANLTALAAARAVKACNLERAVVYQSDQTHSCVERALKVLGLRPDRIRKLASDEAFRLPMPRLARAVAEDRAAGLEPFCVVANVGTTNTGAVDPLPEIAEFCERERLWLHADGAYGAAAALSEQARPLVEGVGRVDSLALDPHKWLFQPYEIGCVLVRDRRWLKETFHVTADYLKDVELSEEEVNFCDYGVQLTRSFRALKLWMSLEVFGRQAFADAIARGIELAEVAERAIRELPGWRVVTRAQLAVMTFRFEPDGASASEADAVNNRVVAAMIADGFAFVTSTRLRGEVVLRLCTINPRATDEDVQETVRRLDQFARASVVSSQ
jgi:aromatic-L-amino-acid/L-tryptophan decarboxylase